MANINVDYNSVKSAGIYSSGLITTRLNKGTEARQGRFCYWLEFEVPENELDVYLHMIVCMTNAFGASGKYRVDYIPFERFYFAATFLIPLLDKPLDESSVMSRIINDRTVAESLKRLKELTKKKKGFFAIKKEVNYLASAINATSFIKKSKFINVSGNNDFVVKMKDGVNCGFVEVPDVWDNFAPVHTLDIVFGQDTSGTDIEKEQSLKEEYTQKLLKQREKMSFLKSKKLRILYPLYNIFVFAFFFAVHFVLLEATIKIKSVDICFSALAAVMYGLSCRKVLTFEQDRITLRNNKGPMSDAMYVYQGSWSYYKIVEYGIYKKFGIKYIYFSKTQMTNDEFKKFKKKIIPYDYDSVAVPYKKDYMKIAENLVFATRKDR